MIGNTVKRSIYLAVALFFYCSLSLQAATFKVTKQDDTNDGMCGEDCSLREAIVAANNSVGVDIVVMSDDAYTLSLVGSNEEAAATGDLDITDSLVITGNGATISAASLNDRVFHVHASAGSVEMADLSIHDGDAAQGGAIYNNGNLTLTLCNLNGFADLGGGIYNSPTGSMTLNGGAVDGTAEDSGGGIYNLGTMTLSNITMDNSSAVMQGGAIYNQGGITIENSAISGRVGDFSNSDAQGGAIYNTASGTLDLMRVLVRRSSALDSGGGIFNQGTINITNSTLSGNSTNVAGKGSAISNSGTITLLNVTIAENTDGVINNIGTINFTNTIAWSNSVTVCLGSGTFNSNGYNIAKSDCSLNATGDIDMDPKLTPLGDFGGSLQTYALLKSSPAIDAGDNNVCPATDQRGFSRPKDGDLDATADCDIGSFELESLQADVEITKNVSPNPVPVGNKVTFTFTVTNNGPDPAGNMVLSLDLSSDFYHDPGINGISSSGTFTRVGGTSSMQYFCCLPPSTSGDFSIWTTSNSGGTLSAEATLYGSVIDPDEDFNYEPLIVQVTGGPGIDLSPLNHNFGEVQVNTSTSTEITVYNQGDQDLIVSNTAFSGFFTAASLDPTAGTTPCGTSTPVIAAGSSCTMGINYVPQSANDNAFSLIFTSNDGGGDAAIAFTATLLGLDDENGSGDSNGDSGGGTCFIGTAANDLRICSNCGF